MKKRLIAAVAVAATVSMVGCSNGTSDPSGLSQPADSRPAGTESAGPESASTESASAESMNAVNELYAFGVDPAAVAIANAVVEREVATCMQDAGFDYSPAPEPSPDELEIVRQRRLLTFPLGQDRTWLGDQLNRTSETGPPSELSESDQSAYQAALFGPDEEYVTVDIDGYFSVSVPGAGCLGQAQADVYGIPVEVIAAGDVGVFNNASFAHELAVADPSVQAAMASWRDCMVGQGFDYPDFPSADAARSTMGSDEAQAMATIDEQCSREAGLDSAYHAAFAASMAQLDEDAFHGSTEYADAVQRVVDGQ